MTFLTLLSGCRLLLLLTARLLAFSLLRLRYRRLWQPDYPYPGYYAFGYACEGTMEWVFNYGIVLATTHDWSYTIPSTFLTSLPAAGASTVYLPGISRSACYTYGIDACDNPITPTLVTTPSATACEGTMAWVFNYRDCAGNNHDWSYIYTIDIPDFTFRLPVLQLLTCPAMLAFSLLHLRYSTLVTTRLSLPWLLHLQLSLVKVRWRGYSTTGIVKATTMTGLISIPSTFRTSLFLLLVLQL